MIHLSMFQNKWRVTIGDEIWEWETLEELMPDLKVILEMKDKHGRLKVRMPDNYTFKELRL